MSIKASIYHLTHYRYDRPVVLGPQVIRLRPAPHSRTRVLSHSLKVSPADHFVNHQQDPYGNWLSRFVFPEPVTELRIEVDLVADMTVYNPFDFFVEDSAEHWPFDYPEDIRDDLAIYLKAEPVGPDLQAFLATVPRERTRTVDFVVGLNARLAREIGYVIRMEPGVQTPEETFARGTGSCRDTSWLLVQTLRNLGLAARFVSGYLIQLKPDLVVARRPARHRPRLHRPARLGRGLSARRRLDRPRPDLGPPDRREPHPARRDPALPQRRADLRGRERRQCRLRLRHAGRPRRRAPAHHQALLRGGLVGARRPRPQGRRIPRRRRRPPDDGRRADLRLDRRLRGGRVEHRRRRPDEARARRHADPPPARPLRPRRLPALRPGQVVPGREPAALDLLALLAPRRHADLAGRPADRRGGRRDRGRPGRGRAAAQGHRDRARRRARDGHPGLRGPGAVDRQGGRPPGQRHPPGTRSSRTRRSATASPGSSSAASPPPRATCCRSSAGSRGPRASAGARRSGSSAAAFST